MNEEWRQIPGFGGHYEASSLGNVRVKDRVIKKADRHTGAEMEQFYAGRELKQKVSKGVYRTVHIGVDKQRTTLSVHRAVLLAFVGEPQPGQEACHANGIGSDNRVENLRWDSHLANNHDRLKHGTYKRGQEHPMAKFSQELIHAVLAGAVSLKEAEEKHGMSMSSFYRIKRKAGAC